MSHHMSDQILTIATDSLLTPTKSKSATLRCFAFFRVLLILLAILPVLKGQTANQGPSTSALLLNQPLERTLTGGEPAHHFTLELKAGDWIRIVIAQRDIDLNFSLVGPRGEKLREISGLVSIEREPAMVWMAEADGTYSLNVSTLNPKARAGSYLIKLTEKRSGTQKDRDLLSAEMTLSSGEVLLSTGAPENLALALEKFKRAAVLFGSAGEVWQTALAMRRQAFVLVIQNDLKSARQIDQEALTRLETKYGQRHLKLAPALWDLADKLFRSGNLPEARKKVDRALEITRETTGNDSIQTGLAYLRLADVLNKQGDSSAADVCQKAIDIYDKHYGKGALEATNAYALAGNIFQRDDNIPKARSLYEMTLQAIDRSYGAESLQAVNTLYTLSQLCAGTGDPTAALTYQQQVIRIIEKHYGESSRQALNAHGSFGEFLLTMGRPQEARAQFEISLKRSAPGSDGVTNALWGIARAMIAANDFIGARQKFDEAIAIAEPRYGQDSRLVIGLQLAKLKAYPAVADYLEGAKCYAKVLDVVRRAGGAPLAEALATAADFDVDHNHTLEGCRKYEEAISILDGLGEPYVLRAANLRRQLGESLPELGRAIEGIALLRNGLKSYESAYGERNPALLETLASLAGALIFDSRFDEAESTLDRALRIVDENHLSEQIISARMFGLMASVMSVRGRLEPTAEAARRSLKIYDRRRQFGIGEGEIFVRNTLVETLLLLSKLSEARDVLDKTLDLARQEPETSQTGLINTRVLMAALLARQGEKERAIGFLRDVKKMGDSLIGSGDLQAIAYLNYAANVAMQLDMKTEAREFSRLGAEMTEARLGRDNPITARVLANQALALLSLEDYEGAEKLALKAAEVVEKFPGHNPTRPLLLVIRGEALVRKGKLADGLKVIEDAVKMMETQIGARNRITAYGINRLGWLRRKDGNDVMARSLFLHGAEISNNYMQDTLPLLSMAEQQSFLQMEMPEQLSGLFTTIRDGDDVRSAYQSVFRWKGSLIESLRRQASITRLGRAEKYGEEIKQLIDVKSRLARWYSKSSEMQFSDWNKENNRVTEEKEQLERSLERATKSGDFVDPLASGVLEFQRLLSADEAFVDIYVYDYQNADESTEKRYIAVVTAAKGNPHLVDLGATNKVDDAVQAWREDVFSRKAGVDDAWKALASKIWRQVADAFPSGVLKIWVSPDGDLARIPWQLLPATYANTRTLLLTQTDSAREFTRLRQARSSAQFKRPTEILLVGDIDFNAGSSQTANPPAEDRFSGLKATRGEIELLRRAAGRFHVAPPLTGSDATKEKVIEALQRANYAHIATHGYFAKETKPLTSNPDESRFASPLREMERPITRNPLVESGIALAGANVVDPITLERKGLLTAEEITSLDLRSCELLTLSACDTGRGEEVTGQGVLGFRAAVMAAGSRSLLMSLWKVPDRATADFMEAFYNNLWIKRMNKADALLNAQKAVRDGGYPEPINWAGWVLVGDAW